MSNSITALLGVAFSAGLNVYATVLALGVMHRLEVYHLPDSLAILASTPVLIAAVVLYVVEFVADKIPLVDSVWDGIHTVIRPVAGALLAYGMVGSLEPQWQIIAALAGGGCLGRVQRDEPSDRTHPGARHGPARWRLRRLRAGHGAARCLPAGLRP